MIADGRYSPSFPRQVVRIAQGRITDPRVCQAIELMEARSGPPLSVEALAAAVGLSRSRLEHIFNQETGTSVGKQLHAARLASAKRLLAGPALRVKEVSSACGYACTPDLTRAFKAAFGLTPSEFRHSTKR